MIQMLETRIVKMDEEIESIKNGMEDKTDGKVELQSEKLSVKCNICENTFHRFSDLENHIKAVRKALY